MDIRSYLNEYLRITRSCILSPEAFFNEIKGEEKRYLKPLAYALISLAVFSVGSSLLFFLLPYYASRDLITFNSVISIGFGENPTNFKNSFSNLIDFYNSRTKLK